MLDKLVADPEPKRGNPTGANQYGKPDGERKAADMPDCSPSQMERAKANGIGERAQRHLDKVAKVAPDYLPRIAAKEITINRAAVELGIVKVRTPLEQALSAFQRLSDDDKEKFMELAESLMESA